MQLPAFLIATWWCIGEYRTPRITRVVSTLSLVACYHLNLIGVDFKCLSVSMPKHRDPDAWINRTWWDRLTTMWENTKKNDCKTPIHKAQPFQAHRNSGCLWFGCISTNSTWENVNCTWRHRASTQSRHDSWHHTWKEVRVASYWWFFWLS